jgi:hypothetical protein
VNWGDDGFNNNMLTIKRILWPFMVLLLSILFSCTGKNEKSSKDDELNIHESENIIFNEINIPVAENNLFIDDNRICGFWSKKPHTIDTERNLRQQHKCYMITNEKTEDYYNKYIGKISIYFGGTDTFNILSVNKISENIYEFQLGITTGGWRDIPHITYGNIRMEFIENDILYFEIIDIDDEKETGFYESYFFDETVLFYRAIMDNSLIDPNEKEPKYWIYSPLPYMDTHIMKSENTKIYEESDINSNVIMILEKNTRVQVIDILYVLGSEATILTIDNLTAPLVLIKTQNEKTGWCFEGYLKKIDK